MVDEKNHVGLAFEILLKNEKKPSEVLKKIYNLRSPKENENNTKI